MSDILGCFLNPGACIDGAVASWLAWFPFGSHGLMFAMGMVAGAALGRWGVAAVFVALAALKVAGKTPDVHEQLAGGKDAAPPVPKPKKRKTLF